MPWAYVTCVYLSIVVASSKTCCRGEAGGCKGPLGVRAPGKLPVQSSKSQKCGSLVSKSEVRTRNSLELAFLPKGFLGKGDVKLE